MRLERTGEGHIESSEALGFNDWFGGRASYTLWVRVYS